MTSSLDKDSALLALLDRLRHDLGTGAFDVVDHWEPDVCAIGIAMPADHAQLVYISSFGHPDGEFDYELETAPNGNDDLYNVAGRGDASYSQLRDVIKRHLKLDR